MFFLSKLRRSNVGYGADHATEAQVKQAVQIAQAADFVDSVGYAGPVAQGGANLSGGQKQRLAIARAVCRKPEIYIFDDSFSALDYRTDRALCHCFNTPYTQAYCY